MGKNLQELPFRTRNNLATLNTHEFNSFYFLIAPDLGKFGYFFFWDLHTICIFPRVRIRDILSIHASQI